MSYLKKIFNKVAAVEVKINPNNKHNNNNKYNNNHKRVKTRSNNSNNLNKRNQYLPRSMKI